MFDGCAHSLSGDFEAMSREFPDLINPWKAADGRRVFQGTMPLKRMTRLGPLLAPENRGAGRKDDEVVWTDAEFSAGFGHDEQGMVTVDLQVSADLPLICQRSLAPYPEPVERRSLLVVIEDVAEQEFIPENYEPVLVEHGRMALQDLVEDELLLAVPQVPRNPATAEIELSTDGKVTPPSGPNEERTRRPFEGLAGLLKESEKK